jgi:hypothetical protein
VRAPCRCGLLVGDGRGQVTKRACARKAIGLAREYSVASAEKPPGRGPCIYLIRSPLLAAWRSVNSHQSYNLDDRERHCPSFRFLSLFLARCDLWICFQWARCSASAAGSPLRAAKSSSRWSLR